MTVGLEAAGHYHRPLLVPTLWPSGWELLELNPAHVAEQRRVQGRRRVKTDAIDLEAVTELVLAGRGAPVPGRFLVRCKPDGSLNGDMGRPVRDCARPPSA